MDAPRLPEITTRDGRRLHAEAYGTGSPTVVFESGMGFSRNEWGAVLPPVAEHTTAVAYDRSGLGKSPPDSARRDLARLGSDLVDLLAGLGDGPFVLVGHSWGGPIVRTAAVLAPDRIAGLVLVDQSDEHCDLFFSRAQRVQARLSRPMMALMVRTGMLRRIVRKQSTHLPEPWAAQLCEEDGTVASLREQHAELDTFLSDLTRLRDHPLDLPDVPVTVISGTKPGFGERGMRPQVIAGHRATADSHPQGRHVLADKSSHYVPLSEPQLIVDEIIHIVDAATS